MRGRTAVTTLASTAAMGFLVLAIAVPAQAASEAAQAPAPEAAPAQTQGVRAVVVIAQVASGAVVLRLGDTGPAVSDIQRRLDKVGILTEMAGTYSAATVAAVKHFQSKFFLTKSGAVNARTYRKLAKISKHNTPAICTTRKRIICVDKTQKTLRYFVNGVAIKTFDARFGGPGMRTREGNFRVFLKRQKDRAQSGTPMNYSMYFSGGQAIHQSIFFKAVGYYGASHGCVNIRDLKGMTELWKMTKIGTPVKVYH